MKCNLTENCQGNLQLKPEQDDSIKFSWQCDICKEIHIEQRSKQELIDLYVNRVIKLKEGWTIQEIYNAEALDLLRVLKVQGVPDEDLKYLLAAQEISERLIEKMKGKKI